MKEFLYQTVDKGLKDELKRLKDQAYELSQVSFDNIYSDAEKFKSAKARIAFTLLCPGA